MAMAFSLAALASELRNDPAVLGYAPAVTSGDENTLVTLINEARASGEYQQDRDPVTPDQVFAQVNPTEFLLVTATGLARLQTMFALPVLDLASTNVKTMLDDVFPNGGPTRQALAVLQKRAGSRAELLFGRGYVVTQNQIGQALRM